MARKGENIHKRKDGRWEGRYIKGRRSDGRAAWGYVYGSSYTNVKYILTQKKAESGFYQLSSTDLTFAELAETWLCSVRLSVKESTFAHYRYTLTHYLCPVLGGFAIQKLNEALLEQKMLQIIQPMDGSHKPLGTTSAQECLSMLRRICKYAAHLRLLRPMEINVKLPKSPKKEQETLPARECTALLDYVLEAPTPRKLGLLFGFQMGLRIGEICGLQWGDFDWKEQVVTIRRTVNRISCGDGHTKIVVQLPKTRSSFRTLPIPRTLFQILKMLNNDFSAQTWFLSGSAEKPVEPRCYRKSIDRYLEHAAVRRIRAHALRHTFATTCLQAGCDVKTLSALLGHANANITLQRYVHTDLARMKTEVDRIFSGGSTIRCQ